VRQHDLDITVAICTWNRADLLQQTLAQMCALDVPEDVRWELLVINNNCTDHTDEVIARHASELPIRRLFEPKPGHSNARNCGVANARGVYTIWTDDDVLVDPQWIRAYVDAFRRWPNGVLFGGPIEPWYESEPPSWISDGWKHVASVYAIRDLGDEPFRFTTKMPYGANIVFRSDIQSDRGFDPALGRTPGKLLSGDETSIARSLMQEGAEGWWVPEARVRHFVPNERLTFEYLNNWFYAMGQTRATNWCRTADDVYSGRGKWLRMRTAYVRMKYEFEKRFRSPDVWVCRLAGSAQLRGWRDTVLAYRRTGKLGENGSDK